jgi:hypothetical protein
MDGRGYTAADWAWASTFKGRCATPHDVDAGAAVFALGDTLNGRPLPLSLPQPVIWYDDDEEFAALIVQAEVHETEDGDTLEVLGLLLPHGRTVVGFMDDVDEVDATDPVWVSLLEADRSAANEQATEEDEGGLYWADEDED